MTTAMWGKRTATPKLTDSERKIRSVIGSNSEMRQSYERDLNEFRARRSEEGAQGPELPTLRDMQGRPGVEVAEFIASRVATISSWDN